MFIVIIIIVAILVGSIMMYSTPNINKQQIKTTPPAIRVPFSANTSPSVRPVSSPTPPVSPPPPPAPVSPPVSPVSPPPVSPPPVSPPPVSPIATPIASPVTPIASPVSPPPVSPPPASDPASDPAIGYPVESPNLILGMNKNNEFPKQQRKKKYYLDD